MATTRPTGNAVVPNAHITGMEDAWEVALDHRYDIVPSIDDPRSPDPRWIAEFVRIQMAQNNHQDRVVPSPALSPSVAPDDSNEQVVPTYEPSN